jgi:hypothetical protein
MAVELQSIIVLWKNFETTFLKKNIYAIMVKVFGSKTVDCLQINFLISLNAVIILVC